MTPSPVCLLDCTFLKAVAPTLEPELLRDLDSLYAFYHRQWWCYRRRYFYFKCLHALFNALALLVTAAGMILGSVTQDSLWVTSLSALGVVLKGWSDFKKFSIKVDMCHFAMTTYAKTLTELRNYVRGLAFDEDGFLIKMQTLDDIITDFAPPLSDGDTATYRTRFQYVPAEACCFADSQSRMPVLHATRLPLLEKREYKTKTAKE